MILTPDDILTLAAELESDAAVYAREADRGGAGLHALCNQVRAEAQSRTLYGAAALLRARAGLPMRSIVTDLTTTEA